MDYKTKYLKYKKKYLAFKKNFKGGSSKPTQDVYDLIIKTLSFVSVTSLLSSLAIC